MKYISTRCCKNKYTFEEVFMNGLSKDGGLYIPDSIPTLELNNISNMSIYDLAFTIFRCYIDTSEINDNDLYNIINASFIKVPIHLKQFDNFSLLELFHGPTYSFKDIALQVVGNLFEYFCKKRNEKINILGATSGDTGSAAIYGIKEKSNIKCFILYPKNKVSNIQRRQMTTIDDSNIHSIEIDGNFDDCQKIVKDLFLDNEFKTEYKLSSVNSINWARIISQIVYYFYAYFQLNKNNHTYINFSVPTGNFGNILAGFYAKNMGLPIYKLLIATNHNDILYRILETGVYEKKEFKETLTPAMDITISSNFERLLWYLIYETDKNKITVCEKVDAYMQLLQQTGKFTLEKEYIFNMKNTFISEKITDDEIIDTVKYVYNIYNYIPDPHTTVGIKAYMKYNEKIEEKITTICIATAHPSKFEDTIYDILQIKNTPEQLKELYSKQEKIISLPMNTYHIKMFIKDNNKV